MPSATLTPRMSLRSTLRLPRGSDGLPRSSSLEARIARLVTAFATLWMALISSWEMFGPVLAGHWAAAASMGIIAENMLRWGIIGPVWEYTATNPGPEMFYCHHPWGIFWVTTLFMKVFGRHDVVCRLPAIVLSTLTPPILYAIGRAIWRPASGAAAAVGFVVLPITLAFANFNVLEVPLMFWTLVSIWGAVRLSQTNRTRYLAATAIGLVMALHSDWPAYVFSGFILGFWLFRGYLGGRKFFGPVHERRFAEAWIVWATLSVLSGVFYLAVFHKAGKLGDLLAIYGSRSSGNSLSLSAVLASRRYWIELSFTPIVIALGKIAAIVSVLRLVVLRYDAEIFPLALLSMATFQYVVFKQGADIHVFWPQPFGAYFALAMGAVVATLASFIEFVRGAVRRRRGLAKDEIDWIWSGILALLLISPVFVAALRDAVPAVVYARRTGGRFNEKGLPIASDGDKIAMLQDLAQGLPKDAVVEMHESMHPNWSQTWALGGRLVHMNRPLPAPSVGGKDKPYLVSSRFATEDHLATLAAKFHVTTVGHFWRVDPRKPAAPIDAFSFVEREPTLVEWAFVSATEPVRKIVADPWLTWELRTHWKQDAPVPDAAPKTFDEQRIAYDIAIERGDEARAAALLVELKRQLRPVEATFEGGLEIVGVQMNEGVHPRLDIVFRAPGPMPMGSFITVRSKVLERARGSLTMADPALREVGQPLAIPPTRFRKGFLYVDPVSIVKRPGTEIFQVSWNGRGRQPMRVVGTGLTTVDVLKLE